MSVQNPSCSCGLPASHPIHQYHTFNNLGRSKALQVVKDEIEAFAPKQAYCLIYRSNKAPYCDKCYNCTKQGNPTPEEIPTWAEHNLNQRIKKRKAQQDDKQPDCYCVCHSPTSSRAACEHCKGQYLRVEQLREELEIIAAAIYAGGVIDKVNNPDLKLDLEKVPSDSRVQKGIDQLLALFSTAQQQLLTELMGQKEGLYRQEDGKPYATGNGGLANIYYNRLEAVPVSVLERKLKEMQ